MYGVFIFLIYLLLSLPFHLLDSVDPEILNNISTNTTLNIIFFVIFIIFAFSFFGYYEITLPTSWSNKMDDKASSFGGIHRGVLYGSYTGIGIFFLYRTNFRFAIRKFPNYRWWSNPAFFWNGWIWFSTCTSIWAFCTFSLTGLIPFPKVVDGLIL